MCAQDRNSAQSKNQKGSKYDCEKVEDDLAIRVKTQIKILEQTHHHIITNHAVMIAGTLQTDPRSGGIKRSSGVNVLPAVAEGPSLLLVLMVHDDRTW